VALITALEKQKRRARVSIDLDGAYGFSLCVDLVVERHLAVGVELTEEQRRDLEAEDGRRGAIAAALRLLAIQQRSEKDLRSRLGRKGYRRDAIDAAVGRMRDLGYLNDATFARSYVEARQSSTPRSRRALSFELGRKGVDREVAATAVETLSDEEAAFDAAQRRLRALQGIDRQTFTRRLGSFLASRGFGYGVARGTIDRCWLIVSAEEDVEADDRDALTEYGLYLEPGPKRRKTMVHVLDLLGCIANAPTTEDALAATPEAIEAYLRFLKRIGEDIDPDAPSRRGASTTPALSWD